MFLNFMSADFAKKLDIKVKICIMVVCATVAHTTLFLEKSMIQLSVMQKTYALWGEIDF